MQDQELQITKLSEMLGSKLDESTQSMVKTLLTGILLETNFDRLKSLMNTLLEKLGADVLPTETQNQLIEKILDVVQLIRDGADWKMHASDFKWNNYSTTPDSINEVKKSDFKWQKNQGSVFGIDKGSSVKKVSKSAYKWGPDPNSMGSGIKGGII